MKYPLKSLGFVFLTVTAIGCGGGTSTSSQIDSVEVEVQEVVEQVQRLNDTIYPSVDKVWYRVETADTTISGEIVSLEDLYKGNGSVLTFRTGPSRLGVYGAELDTVPTRFEHEWTANTDADRSDTVFGPWGGGTGWTGQPLFVQWPDSVVARMRKLNAIGDDFSGREIIVGSLCGNVYFINPETGKFTRQPIAVGNTIKGTVSLDPTFNGNLYVGHGTPARRPFGAVTVDLNKNEVVDIFKEDPKALRNWGAYDSSPVRVGNFVFRPAENGSLYKFIENDGRLELHSVLRYKVNGSSPGIESSMAVYANYGFIADNHGNVLAVNLDNLNPVWHYALGDDTDASPALAVEDGHPFLYVGCEIDRQPRGYAVFAKLDALTGDEVWRIEPEGRRREDGKKHFDGGFYASPLLGCGDCEDLIFTNMVKNTSGSNGTFMAIDRTTGKVVYELPLRCYSWSSPVGFLTKDKKMIIVTADGAGNLYLIDGKKGEIITRQSVGNNFESSPVAFGNSIVIGSRGNGIHKLTLK